MDTGKLWIHEAFGHRRNDDDPLCKSGTAKGTWVSEKSRKEDTAPRTPKGSTSRMRRWKSPGCKNGIRNRDFEDQLRLGSGGMLKKVLYEIVSVKIAKQVSGSYVASRKIKDWTLWRGRPPPKRLKSDSHD
jgi:hypothetical protein